MVFIFAIHKRDSAFYPLKHQIKLLFHHPHEIVIKAGAGLGCPRVTTHCPTK